MYGLNETSVLGQQENNRQNWVLRNSKYVMGGIILVLLACLGVSAYHGNTELVNDVKLTEDAPISDLDKLLIGNGLEKWIGLFENEGIDLETFATLTNDELLRMGVRGYDSRQRMVKLIAQLSKKAK